jgi:hypothetical protein
MVLIITTASTTGETVWPSPVTRLDISDVPAANINEESQ